MANWKFTDDFGKTFPSLQQSILGILVFSDHTITGTDFTGTLDTAATGNALKIIGSILDTEKIALKGTVVSTASSLTVTLRSTDDDAFAKAIAAAIPLIGGEITQKAWMDVKTIATTTDPEGDAPAIDVFDLGITLAIGKGTVDITSQIPMSSGFFHIAGDFSNSGILSIGLEDLNFLMGTLAGGNSWFPTTELGPYSQGQTSFGLLSMALVCYVTIKPSLSITISSIDVQVGISKLPLKGNALYLDPLGVWVTVTNPTSKPAATWGLLGSVKLCNFANPGPAGLSEPDFEFDFTMTFPTETDKTFGISANLDNPSGKSVNVMLQDLMGQGTNVGIGDKITVNSFEFETTADTSTGTITDFSTSVVMSGGFGFFEKITVDKMSVSVIYTGD
jgi:hypothetical protein